MRNTSRNTNRNSAMIVVLISALLLPQLFFWWLAPAVVVRFIVFIGLTVITTSTTVCVFITYRRYGLRKMAGFAVLAGVMEGITMFVCGLLLVLNTTIRSAVFALVIISLLTLICLIPMLESIGRSEEYSSFENIDMNDTISSSTYTNASQELSEDPDYRRVIPLPPRNR